MDADFRRGIDEIDALRADPVESSKPTSSRVSIEFHRPSGISAN
jgi:hypothetical protein